MRITVRDAAKLLNVSEKTIYRWVAMGELPAHRVNDQYRFNRAELLEWVTSRKTTRKLNPEIFQESDKESLQKLVDTLRRGGIFHKVQGSDKNSVLRNIVSTILLPKEVNRDLLLQILLAREALGSTAIGDGIAIPHPRNPIVLRVPISSVTLCFLESPIDFAALAGQKVHALFTIIAPTVKEHLHLLSRLAFVVRDAAVKTLILRQAPGEEILEAFARLEPNP